MRKRPKSRPKNTEDAIYAELEIGPNVFEDFQKHPKAFARAGFVYARALDECRAAEDKLNLVWAELYDCARLEEYLEKENERKAWIYQQEEYREAKAVLRKAKFNRDTLQAGKEAFIHRKDMLQQIGPVIRKELEAVLAVPKGTSAYADAEGAAVGAIKSVVDRANAHVQQIYEQKKGNRNG